MIKVIKKDGTIEDFNTQKIIDAVSKSAQRASVKLEDEDYLCICEKVLDEIEEGGYYEEEYDSEVIAVIDIHSIVENVLLEYYPQVGKQYQQYRNYKLDFTAMLDTVYKKSQSIKYFGDVTNANTDSSMVSTQRSLIFQQLNKELYQKFNMTREERQATQDGYIYIHDMSARRDTMNCCLFDVKAVLSGGFEMGNVWYNEPKTVDTAFDVIGDIVFGASAQQYGRL